MHDNVSIFCNKVKAMYPDKFKGDILDVGSLDINGSNRYLFSTCNYTGLDICAGKNVDIVTPIHKYNPDKQFDVIISTEMLEHDKYYNTSIKHMIELLKEDGLMLLTMATTGRTEHGTNRCNPEDSPLTNDYYKNLVIKDTIDHFLGFKEFMFFVKDDSHDLQIAGVK